MRRVLSLSEVDALKKACRNSAERELIDDLVTGARLSDIARETRINHFILLSMFKGICARAELLYLTPHDLRRKFYQVELHIKGGYNFSALSTVMEVVK